MDSVKLLKLADLVEQSAAVEGFFFTMCVWGQVEDAREAPGISCGTSACMMGTAAISGVFAEDGLTYEVTPLGPMDIEDEFYQSDLVVRHKSAPEDGALKAATILFGLNEEEACFLFLPSWYPPNVPLSGITGARYAAQRVRDFVANGGIF